MGRFHDFDYMALWWQANISRMRIGVSLNFIAKVG
jgi:hypothetical protein